jgi:hypothetical protein
LQTYVVVADFYDPKTPLPPHQLVVNGIGDFDVAAEALVAAESLLAHVGSGAERAGGGAGYRPLRKCPALGKACREYCSRDRDVPSFAAGGPNGPAAVARARLQFSAASAYAGLSHGQHFVRVESPAALAAAVAELPGSRTLKCWQLNISMPEAPTDARASTA